MGCCIKNKNLFKAFAEAKCGVVALGCFGLWQIPIPMQAIEILNFVFSHAVILHGSRNQQFTYFAFIAFIKKNIVQSGSMTVVVKAILSVSFCC